MPKIHDEKAARTRNGVLNAAPGRGKDALRQSLRGVSYEEGALAIGFDPNTLGADPEELGLDPERLSEDLSVALKTLYPAYEFYLQAQPMALAVGAAYSDDALRGDRGTADGRFSLVMNELVGKAVDLCRNAEFTRGAGIGAREKMTKEDKRRRAEKADKLLKELQLLIAAMVMMIGQVARSAESTRVMQLAMTDLMEARTHLSWFYRTFRTEGFEWATKRDGAPGSSEPPR